VMLNRKFISVTPLSFLNRKTGSFATASQREKRCLCQ
jgi:hypothetical protein